MRTRTSCTLPLALLLLLCPATGRAQEKAEEPHRKIALIGASLTKGFSLRLFAMARKDARAYIEKKLERKLSDREYRLRIETGQPAAILRQAWGEKARIRQFADLNMFRLPARRGRLQVDRTIKFAPDLIVGMDFLFWFGFGWEVKGGDKEVAARMRLQERGLKLLEELLARTEAILVLGDYPKLKLKGSFIISESQVPSPAAIDKLNAALRTWAKGRDRVHIWPLSDLVRQLYEEGLTRGEGKKAVRHGARNLLQADRLHPTRLGTALVLHRLSGWLARKEKPAVALFPEPPGLERLAELAEAELHLATPLAPLEKESPRREPAGKL